MNTLPRDVNKLILLETSYDDLVAACQTNKSLHSICKESSFWLDKAAHDLKMDSEKIKDLYYEPTILFDPLRPWQRYVRLLAYYGQVVSDTDIFVTIEDAYIMALRSKNAEMARYFGLKLPSNVMQSLLTYSYTLFGTFEWRDTAYDIDFIASFIPDIEITEIELYIRLYVKSFDPIPASKAYTVVADEIYEYLQTGSSKYVDRAIKSDMFSNIRYARLLFLVCIENGRTDLLGPLYQQLTNYPESGYTPSLITAEILIREMFNNNYEMVHLILEGLATHVLNSPFNDQYDVMRIASALNYVKDTRIAKEILNIVFRNGFSWKFEEDKFCQLYPLHPAFSIVKTMIFPIESLYRAVSYGTYALNLRYLLGRYPGTFRDLVDNGYRHKISKLIVDEVLKDLPEKLRPKFLEQIQKAK